MMSIYKLASEIIRRQSERGQTVSNLQLQKLAYFCYAVGLGNNINLLDRANPFDAWDYGPVIPDLYYSFRDFGSNPIPHNIAQSYANLYDGSQQLDDPDNQIIDLVLDQIGNATANQLVQLSHEQGSPWDKVYSRSKGSTILDTDVSQYFRIESDQ